MNSSRLSFLPAKKSRVLSRLLTWQSGRLKKRKKCSLFFFEIMIAKKKREHFFLFFKRPDCQVNNLESTRLFFAGKNDNLLEFIFMSHQPNPVWICRKHAC